MALACVDDAVDVLESVRNAVKFDKLFNKVEEDAGEVPIPSLAKKTGSVRTARDYYRVNVFLLFLDTCIGHLPQRFSRTRRGAAALCTAAVLVRDQQVRRPLSSGRDVRTFAELQPQRG